MKQEILISPDETRKDAPLWAAAVSLLALLGVAALAFSAATKPGPADTVTLFFLTLMTAIFGYAPFLRRLREDRDAAAFVLCAAMFVVYGLSRRVTAAEPPTLGEAKIGYAAFLVIGGALIGAPAWAKNFNGWTRAAAFALSLLLLLGWLAFRFLSMFYEVGETKTINPATWGFLLLQTIEYGALALCCSAVTANSRVRRFALVLLPALLLALAMRYKTMPAAQEDE